MYSTMNQTAFIFYQKPKTTFRLRETFRCHHLQVKQYNMRRKKGKINQINLTAHQIYPASEKYKHLPMRLQVPLLENALKVNKRLMFFLLSHSKTIEKQMILYPVYSGKKHKYVHKYGRST